MRSLNFSLIRPVNFLTIIIITNVTKSLFSTHNLQATVAAATTTTNQEKTNTVYHLTQCDRTKVNISCPSHQVIDILTGFYARQNNPSLHAQCGKNTTTNNKVRPPTPCNEERTSLKFRRYLLFGCQFKQQCNFTVSVKTFSLPMAECHTQIRVAELAYRCLNKTMPFIKQKMEYVVKENANTLPIYVPPYELIATGTNDLLGNPEYYAKEIKNPQDYIAGITGPPVFTTSDLDDSEHQETTTAQPDLEITTLTPLEDYEDNGPTSNAVDDNTSTTQQGDPDDVPVRPDPLIELLGNRTYNERIKQIQYSKQVAQRFSTPAYEEHELNSMNPTRQQAIRYDETFKSTSRLPTYIASSQPKTYIAASNFGPSVETISITVPTLNKILLIITLMIGMLAIFSLALYICSRRRNLQRQKLSDKTTINNQHQQIPPTAPATHTPSFDHSIQITDCDYAHSFPNPPQLASESYFKENISSFLSTSPCHDVVDGPIYHSHTMVKYANMRDAYMV